MSAALLRPHLHVTPNRDTPIVALLSTSASDAARVAIRRAQSRGLPLSTPRSIAGFTRSLPTATTLLLVGPARRATLQLPSSQLRPSDLRDAVRAGLRVLAADLDDLDGWRAALGAPIESHDSIEQALAALAAEQVS